MKSFCFILALLILAAVAVAQPTKIAHFDVMPKVHSLPDGTLASIVILHRGPGLENTPEQQDVLIQYSKDGGRTWGERSAVAKLPNDEHGWFGFGINFVDRDGEIHVFLLCDGKTGVIRARTKEGVPPVEPIARQTLNVWHLRSTDGRTKWTTPKKIFDKRTSDLQGVTQLKSGRIIMPVSGWVNRSWRERGQGFAAFTYLGSWDATVVYSDDGGETWTQSKSLLRAPTPGLAALGAIEPVVVQLNDGRVWMLIRTQMGRFYESFSNDGAEWSPAKPSSIVSSDSPAGLLRLDDKRILMLWNNCQRHPYATGGRHALHGAITDDDGKTWRGYREVVRDELARDPAPPSGDHGVSYPFLTKTADGKIAFSMWVQTGPGRSVLEFEPKWLEETKQRDDFAKGMAEWSTFGSKGVEAIDAADAEDGKAISIKKADENWPAAAVRNFPMSARGTLTMRVKATADANVKLVLTDHFSPPFDWEDAIHGIYVGHLSANASGAGAIAIPTDKWAVVKLDWSNPGDVCRVTVDGRSAGELNAQRSARGVCYLRFQAESGGVLLDSVEVTD